MTALSAPVLTGCTDDPPTDRPTVVQPGAPGEPGRVLTEPGTETAPVAYTRADVRFLQGMIAHHGQALRMTALVAERTDRADVQLLARRIEISQQGEIALMEDWLVTRGEPVAPVAHHHHHGDGLMPGMLTEEQFAQLEAARGAEFDRLFLELMRYHHEGALIMVEELFAAGGGQEPAVHDLATAIDIDQRIEIDRITHLLGN